MKKQAKEKEFTVIGKVMNYFTKKGIEDLYVEIWDCDLLIDDYVGSAYTNEKGEFTVTFKESYFRDLFYDKWPDLYFKIFCRDKLVENTKDNVHWNVKPGVKKYEFLIKKHCRSKKPKINCKRKDVYLKIEKIPGYTPIVPDKDAHGMYGLDCFRNTGHEDGTVPANEIALKMVDVVLYRQYTDATYTTQVADKIIKADINEPPEYARIPGTVLYTKPGERLCIHVLNCDSNPHSLHAHGLDYGIESDGVWPFGVEDDSGLRSDEILPGDTWTYTFEVTDEMIGAWPFHDHHRKTKEFVDRGLFGGIIVRDPYKPKPDYEVPFFMHRLIGERNTAAFDSGTIQPGNLFPYTYPVLGTFDYFCRFHAMFGTVNVVLAGPATANVAIQDGAFNPPTIDIAPGGTVTWTNTGQDDHTVTEQAGAGGQESFCINGRTYAGNTPTIEVESGKRIRWYVFNLDLGMDWHNFHTHAQRWKSGGEYMDTKSLGPAESFVADTIAPKVVLDTCLKTKPNERTKWYKLCAHFPVHCHVEPHMMQGMISLVRVKQKIKLSQRQLKELNFKLPDQCHEHGCPEIDVDRGTGGKGEGTWTPAATSPVFVVHAALMHTGKVVVFSGRAEQYTQPADYPLKSSLYDPATDSYTDQPFTENLFCSGHAFFANGNLLVGGGDRPASGQLRIDSTHIFDAVAENWTKLPAASDMNHSRWYPTLLLLSDQRILAASGNSSGANTMEIFDPNTNLWTNVTGGTKTFNGLYPSLHLLPSGHIFHSRTSWGNQSGTRGAYFTFTGANAGFWTDAAVMQFPDRQEGYSIMKIDMNTSPPKTEIFVIGGGESGIKNQQSCEKIDVTNVLANPPWVRFADMNHLRTNVNGVILPDGKILAIGGRKALFKFAADPDPVLEAEIYDPDTDTWKLTPAMTDPRQYHSVSILLPDGSIYAAGGIHPALGGTPQRDLKTAEIFRPAYMTASRPSITAAANSANNGDVITIDFTNTANVAEVVLLKPMSETHQTDAGQRHVKLLITATTATSVDAEIPSNTSAVPPGYYMLFIVNNTKIPSEGKFIQIG